ncbi:DNA (cytosine-5-)-methyltransferase [Erysipelothrix sp. D19-032]
MEVKMRTISYDRLWELIKERNLSKNCLRNEAKISSSTFSKLINNKDVTTSTLLKICEYLNVELNEIVASINGSVNMKYRVLDLFCGAGGLSLGFKMVGFDVIGGVDFDEDAINTHKLNFNEGIDIHGDITQISDDQINEMYSNGVDVIIGGPPCQGFSVANKWQNDEEKIEKNRLFFEYMRFVDVLHPKVFVIENVRQILTKDNGYAKDAIEKIGEEYGYRVVSKVLNSSNYGVPQKRMRAFFIGVRKDLEKEFDFERIIENKSIVTVKDAISDLYQMEEKNELFLGTENLTSFQKMMRMHSNGAIQNHDVRYPNDRVQERMNFVPQGGNWKNVPPHLWDRQRSNRHSSRTEG